MTKSKYVTLLEALAETIERKDNELYVTQERLETAEKILKIAMDEIEDLKKYKEGFEKFENKYSFKHSKKVETR